MNSRPERTTHHDSEHFYKQLFNASINASYTPLWRIKDGPKGERGGAIIRIKTLQQMNVTHIRKLLADEVAFMVHHKSTDREQMRLIEDLMSRYWSALRDLKFQLERPSQDDKIADTIRNLQYINGKDDPALLLASNIIQPESLKFGHRLRISQDTGFKGTYRERLGRFARKLLTALFGALALIAPMLIMRLHSTLLTQLLTTSVFILAFGCALAYFLDSTDETYIASASAAYAAVLVVFVGASSTS